MDTSSLVTIGIFLITQIIAAVGVWAKMGDRINDLSKELWTAINTNTREVEKLIGKVDRELSLNKGEMMQKITELAGDIKTLDALFWEKQKDRAAMYLHKPDEGSKAMDMRLDKLLDKTQTPEDRAELKKVLLQEVISTRPDTGERPLLEAIMKIDDPESVMPTEPHDKAPDQSLTEKREEDMRHIQEKQETENKGLTPPKEGG